VSASDISKARSSTLDSSRTLPGQYAGPGRRGPRAPCCGGLARRRATLSARDSAMIGRSSRRPQGRDVQCHHVEAVEQVGAEAPGLHFLLQLAAGRGDDAHVHADQPV
jgi:hypothetical protein